MRSKLVLFGVALGLSLLFCGCKSTWSEKNVTSAPPPLLRNDMRVYVAIPFDASYKKNVAQNSGKATSQALYAAFNRYTKAVFLGRTSESVSEALESARKLKADYMVYPNIVKWEDHATEWSGVRDKLELKIDLIDPSTSQLAFSQEINATGKWMTDGGDTPGDLLAAPCEEFVNSLFRHIEKPSALW